jgi:hypothetical protein
LRGLSFGRLINSPTTRDGGMMKTELEKDFLVKNDGALYVVGLVVLTFWGAIIGLFVGYVIWR